MRGADLPYRVPAPAHGSRVRWPDGFGQRFLVFVDVEEEFDWAKPLDRGNRSTRAMQAFPAAHARFAAHGVGLACMVDHPVASDPAAVDILRAVLADGRSSIGAQLHPWVNPPYAAPFAGDSYAGNLPRALEAAKLDELTGLLRATFGAQPLAYRAGRYGIGPATLTLLEERGYRIDTSMRARYDYRRNGGPDFARVGNEAWRIGSMIELPLTVVFAGLLRGRGAALYPRLAPVPRAPGVFARTGLLERIALTPEDMPIAAALRAVTIAVEEERQGLLCFAFHSPTLAPGHTPYVRTAADLARFWTWWDTMLAHLDRLGVQPTTLTEVLAAADASG